jgi:hypothetical protein
VRESESRDGATAVLHGGETDACSVFFLAELLGLRITGVKWSPKNTNSFLIHLLHSIMLYWKSSVHLFELSKKGLVGKVEALDSTVSPHSQAVPNTGFSLSLSLSLVSGAKRARASERARERQQASEAESE